MAFRISASVGAYEAGSVNRKEDVKTVQTMLTEVAKKHGAMFDPKGIDGLIARTASRSATVTAIANFQVKKAGLRTADKRIDVNGTTWKKLSQLVGSAAPSKPSKPATGLVTLTVQHGGKIPTKTIGSTSTAGSMYESSLTLSGGGMHGSMNAPSNPV